MSYTIIQGKKDITTITKCYKCINKKEKKCMLTAIASGTISNPRQDVWLCNKHN